MNKKFVFSKLYHHYFLAEQLEEVEISGISLDSEVHFLLKEIGNCSKYKEFDIFVKEELETFKEKLRDLNQSILDFDKMLHKIPYAWYPNLQRLMLIHSSVDGLECTNVMEINIEKISMISHLIILRVLLYNSYYLRRDEIELNTCCKLFGMENPKPWFRKEDLLLLCSDININDLNVYFSEFSVDIERVTDEDGYLPLLSFGKDYSILSVHDFPSYIFNRVEQIILDKIGSEKELYKHRRGEELESLVYNLMSPICDNIYLNHKYVDIESKKRNWMFLVTHRKNLLYFECKSSAFNIFELDDNQWVKNKLSGAFERTWKTTNALNNTLIQNSEISLFEKRLNDGAIIKIKSKNMNFIPLQVTLYPIDYIGTHLQNYNPKFMEKYMVHPININIIDLMTIVWISMDKGVKYLYKYFKERSIMMNKHKRISYDIDEIDVFGFILSKDYELYMHILESLEESSGEYLFSEEEDFSERMTVALGKGEARSRFNNIMSGFGIYCIVDAMIQDNVKVSIKEIFQMN